MKKAIGVVLLGLVLFGSGCSNVKDIKITEANKDKIWDQIKNTHSLSAEEVRLLLAHQMRTGIAAAFSGNEKATGFPVGKTVGQVINDERQFEQSEEQKQAKENELAARAKVETEKEEAALRNALSVAVYDKGYQGGEFRNYITMGLVYQNKSSKDIRGFKGTLVFRTMFGDVIQKIELEEDMPLRAGQIRRVQKSTEFDEFKDSDVRLRSTDLNNMKVDWEPDEILFADGPKMSTSSGTSE